MEFTINSKRNIFIELNKGDKMEFFSSYKSLEKQVTNGHFPLDDDELFEIEVALMEIIEKAIMENVQSIGCLHTLETLEYTTSIMA